MRGLFITGTDTGVGKTVLSAAVVAAMHAAGERPRAYKPVVTGLDDLAADAAAWPPDHELLGAAARMDPRIVSPISYGPAVSPHLAAELAGDRITLGHLLDGARAALDHETPARSAPDEAALDHEEPARGAPDAAAATATTSPLIVEGVGGLLVPFAEHLSVCDLAVALGLPVVIAARAGLGTINHTLLTLHAARAAGLDVRAVVLGLWPSEPTRLELSNRETIATLGRVDVAVLERVGGPGLDELARAGDTLPWAHWIGPAQPLERVGAAGGIMGGA